MKTARGRFAASTDGICSPAGGSETIKPLRHRRCVPSRRKPFIIAATVALVASTTAAIPTLAACPPRSAGYYTPAQAAQGKTTFDTICAACHKSNLTGQAGPPLTGKRLWRFNLGAGVNAPPVAYEGDGREYIAVAAGGNFQIHFPLGDAVAIFTLPKSASK